MINTSTALKAAPTHMGNVAQLLAHCTDSNTVKAVGNSVTVTPSGIHYIGCIDPGVLPKWYVTLDTTEAYGSSTNEGTYNVCLITWRQHPRMADLWLRTHVPYATCYNTGQLLSIIDDTCGVPSPEHVDRIPPTKKPSAKPVVRKQSTMEWAFKMGTYCNNNTPTPDWSALTAHRGYQWVAAVIERVTIATYQDLTNCFLLGTHCKVGTPFNLVRYAKSASTAPEVYLNTEPKTLKALCCASL